MKNSNLKLLSVAILTLLTLTISSCSSDDNNPIANIAVNEGPNGDIGGDFTGNGGNATRTISWTNNLATADYNFNFERNIPNGCRRRKWRCCIGHFIKW